MAQINLVTGYTGEAHIKSEEDALLNRFLAGQDNSVIDLESTFNDTDCNIDCAVLVSGRLVKTDETETLTFTKPSSGYYRKDGVYAVYKKVTSGVESAELVYCQGTQKSSSASATIGEPTFGADVVASATLLLYTVSWNNAQTKTVTQNMSEGAVFSGAFFEDGETGSGSCYCAGYVQNTSGDYAFTLPLPKLLRNGQSFTITGGSKTIYHRDGSTHSGSIDSEETVITGTRPAWVNIKEFNTGSGYTTGLCMVQYNYQYEITR